MTVETAAYYHWPGFWVGSMPEGLPLHIDVSDLGEEVYRTRLNPGIDVRVLREGMFIFGFSDYPAGQAPRDPVPDFDVTVKATLERVMIMNAHLGCLYTAIHRVQSNSPEIMVVNPPDLIALSTFEASSSGSFGDTRQVPLALARFPSTYSAALPATSDWRIISRTLVVKIETVEQSFRSLNKILAHASPDALLLSDLYLRSCKAYQDHNYAHCMVTAWTVAEKLLQRLWSQYIEDNRQKEIGGTGVTFINTKRKSILLDGRNFSASVVSETLSLAGVLPFQLYQDLTKTRQVRNDWIHDLKPVSRESAEVSVRVVKWMLDLVENIVLEVPLISRIHG